MFYLHFSLHLSYLERFQKSVPFFRVSYEEFFTFDFIASRFDVETEFDGVFLILILF